MSNDLIKKDAMTTLANRLSVDPAELKNTLKATVAKGSRNQDGTYKPISDAEFIAFAAVANQYELNPFLKQIYAFPSQGGIIPIVGIDGWTAIVNRQADFNGVELVENEKDGKLISVTAKFYRKNVENPIVVTEYMDECFNPSKEPWKKWPRRMLRHKAYIQGARIAFGICGIYDEDEGHRIIESEIAEARPKVSAPKEISAPVQVEKLEPVVVDTPKQVETPVATVQDQASELADMLVGAVEYEDIRKEGYKVGDKFNLKGFVLEIKPEKKTSTGKPFSIYKIGNGEGISLDVILWQKLDPTIEVEFMVGLLNVEVRQSTRGIVYVAEQIKRLEAL